MNCKLQMYNAKAGSSGGGGMRERQTDRDRQTDRNKEKEAEVVKNRAGVRYIIFTMLLSPRPQQKSVGGDGGLKVNKRN